MDTKTRTDLQRLLSKLVDQNTLKKPTTSAAVPPAYTATLFPLQQQIINHPSRRKVLLAGRRGSKSYILIYALVKAALENPQSNSLYIATTKDQAKRLIWNDLQDYNERFGLNIHFNHAELIATFSNKSRISLRGLETRFDAEKLRGSFYACVCIDEVGHQKDFLRYTIEEVLDAPLEDIEGTLYLAGTPNRTQTGYFYDVTTKPSQFQAWHFTVLDNPAFPLWAGKSNWEEIAKTWLEDKKRENEWSEDNPIYQREYLAKWIRDSEISVVPFSKDNIYDTPLPPEHRWIHVIGIDTGVVDNFAVAVLAYSPTHPVIHIPYLWEQNFLHFDETCNIIKDLWQRYSPVSIVADPSPGKQLIHDLSTRYNLPIRAAQKRDKVGSVELLVTDFVHHRIQIQATHTKQIEDLKKLQWSDEQKKVILGNDHILHAILYGHTECLTRGYKPLPKPKADPRTDPEEYQKQYRKKQIAKIKQNNINNLRKQLKM